MVSIEAKGLTIESEEHFGAKIFHFVLVPHHVFEDLTDMVYKL